MSHFARTLTGLGTTLVVIGTLLAGCGRTSAPTAYADRPTRPTYMTPVFAKVVAPKAKSAAKSAPTVAAPSGDLAAEGDEDDAPSAPAATGGLKPLPKVTPTPPPGKPPAPPEPDEVDAFHRLLRNYGYKGDRRTLTATVTTVTNQYALNWDPRVNPDQHFGWWQKTLEGIANTPADYRQQAIYLAQHKFDVVYYVWVSKQRPGDIINGRTPPMVDFNEELPIVKGIQDEGLFVQLSPRGTIVDYLRIPTEFLNDYNHLIPIPQSLY